MPQVITYHHRNPALCFPSTLKFLFPAKRRWLYGRNFGKLIGGRLNHKPTTTKIVAWAKSLWVRCVTLDNLSHLSSTRARVTDCMFSGIVSTSVSTPDQHLLESGPADFDTWIDWIHRITKKKTRETTSQLWKRLC